MSISDAVKAYKAALASDPPTTPVPVSIKDTAANLKASLADLETMVTAGVITGIALSDSKAPVLTFARSEIPGVLSDTTTQDATVQLLQKISTSFVLNVTDVPIAELTTLKAVSKTSSLTMAISGTADEVTANLKALQTAAKAKTLSGLSLTAAPDTLAALSVSASDLTANADALGLIKGAFALKVTNVAAADTSKVITAADKLLKTASTANGTSMIDIKDTAANLVANIKALETLAVAGRIGTITVSDGKALVLTGAQIAAATNVLNEDFTSQVSVEATNVAVADVAGLEAKIEDNSRLTLTKVSVADKAAAIQSGIDGLEAVASAWKTAGSSGGGFALANIAVSDKGTLTLAQSKFVADIDALSVLSGPYTLKVTDITVAQALAIKAPSKDATLSLAITDTTTAVTGSIDKLAALVKSKTLASLSLTDATSKALTLTSAQLSANGDTLKLVQSDYKLAVTDVPAKDVATVAKAKNLYSIAIKDTLANVLAGMKTLTPLAASAKIAGVSFTDKTAPTLSIADAFTISTTLPNLKLPDGVGYAIADTASNVIAHARFDVGDLMAGADKVSLTDKTPPNLTLADAKTLKALPNLDPKTKYNVADGGNVIAAQAALSNETVLSSAAAVYINKNFSITQAKAVTGIKTLDKGTLYSINDTADNILAQAAIKSETVLAKANAVNVVDTSTNILAKLDQLEALAKAGKIADITFTDTPTGALSLTDTQLLGNAEAIGKIISQRTLPTLTITPPKQPEPLGPTLPPMRTLTAWSAENTLGAIVNGSYQYRTYMRADRLGNMIGDLVTPAATYNQGGQNPVSFYLMAQDGLGNTTAPLKIADYNTSLGAPGTPRNGGIYLLKPNVYSGLNTANMVDNQLALWLEQQPDNSYTMKFLPYAFSPGLAAADSTVPALTITGSGTATPIVTGIDPNVLNFNWANYSSGNKFVIEYETRNALSPDQKDIYINTFTVNGAGDNVTQNTVDKIQSGPNAGAKLLMTGVKADALTALYTAPDMTTVFGREVSQGGQTGIIFTDFNPATAGLSNDRFLGLGPSTSNTKINTLEYGVVSTDPTVSAQTVALIGMTTSTPAATANDKPSYKFQVFAGDAKLSGSGGLSNMVPTDSLTLNNPVKSMWNQASIGNNTTLFAFQDGNVVHAVQVGSDGKIIADDQFALPPGSSFERYRPLNWTKSAMFEFIWREPVPGSTTGETVIKTRIYDPRGNTPLTISGNNAFNLLAGAAGNDTLVGRGNDVMAGGPGNDTLLGLPGGKDVVSYLGKSTDYKITADPADPFKVVVQDLRNGSPDGTDTLTNIWAIRFADQTVSLVKSSAEKTLTQPFISTSPGITSAIGTSAKGFVALNGSEAGTLSVRAISGNGSLPASAATLVDAIVNASSIATFKTAVQNALTQGASTSPPFTLDFAKTLTNSVDVNVDGFKDSGVRVPLNFGTQETTSPVVTLTPRTIANVPQQVGVALTQNFFSVAGGPGLASGISGSNSSWINNAPYTFMDTEVYTLKLFMGSRDGVSPLPASALQLAANAATATTAQAFTDAMNALWQSNNGYWVSLNAALANPVDINSDGKPDTNVGVPLYDYGMTVSNTIALSSVPNFVNKAATQAFLKLSPGTASASGLNGTNIISGPYTVTGQESGTINVNLFTSGNNSPLPTNYVSLLNAVTSATGPATFDAALANIASANLGVSFTYIMNGTADLLGNGTQATNISFNLAYPQSLDTASGVINFTPA